MRILHLSAAALMLGVAAAAAPRAAAQRVGEPIPVCVVNLGQYRALVQITARTSMGGQRDFGTRHVSVSERFCVTAAPTHRVEIVMQAMQADGSWGPGCGQVLEPGQGGTVELRGTARTPSCLTR
jgi:hypothetical protein